MPTNPTVVEEVVEERSQDVGLLSELGQLQRVTAANNFNRPFRIVWLRFIQTYDCSAVKNIVHGTVATVAIQRISFQGWTIGGVDCRRWLAAMRVMHRLGHRFGRVGCLRSIALFNLSSKGYHRSIVLLVVQSRCKCSALLCCTPVRPA
jgi:hypothetical protein